MIPYAFQYLRVNTWREAVDLLEEHGESARVIAGGQSLLPLLKMRILKLDYIIDVSRIEPSAYINGSANGETKIGAMTTHRTVEDSELIKSRYTLLSEAASSIADTQIRSRGTIGGSICEADPSASYPAAILALDATMVIEGKGGESTVKAQEFFVDAYTTALDGSDILKEIRLPQLPPGTGSCFIKYSRRPQDFAIITAAAVTTVDAEGRIQEGSISLGGIQSVPVRLEKAEKLIQGHILDGEALEGVSSVIDEMEVELSDSHGSATYRKEMAKEFISEALTKSLSRAKRNTKS